jgi:hypothetical protein
MRGKLESKIKRQKAKIKNKSGEPHRPASGRNIFVF